MTNFTYLAIESLSKHQPVYKLVRNEKVLIEDFILEVKADRNLAPQLSELYSVIEDVAKGLRLPSTRYRKLKLGKLRFTPYEAKSSHLRLYLFRDDDLGIVFVIEERKLSKMRI
jgi:hypothetical protein